MLSTYWTTRRHCALSTSTEAMINLRRGRILLSRFRPASALRHGVGGTSCWSPAPTPWWGGSAAAIPASISNTLSEHNAVPLLFLVGLIVWPAAIAICRGYRRNRIGIGLDEPGAVIRAGMLVVVAVALPAGFMAVPTGALDPTATLRYVVRVAEACCDSGFHSRSLLSLLVRFFARRGLRFLQSRGRKPQTCGGCR